MLYRLPQKNAFICRGKPMCLPKIECVCRGKPMCLPKSQGCAEGKDQRQRTMPLRNTPDSHYGLWV